MANTNEITFEINGATYTRKANGYCYVSYEYSESGRVHRIGKAEFESKYAQFQMESAIEAVEESETTEEIEQIAKVMDEAAENPEIPVGQFCEMVEKMNREQNERNEFTNISKEDVVAAIRSEATEAATDPKATEGQKKRTRKSKDIAYEGHEVTLTAKQVDFIRHLPDTNFWENGLDSALWTDVLADEIGGQFAGKPMTVGAMISTICEKGLANRATDRVNGRRTTFMVLTELGKKVAAELGLN